MIVYLIMYCIVMASCVYLYIECGHRHSDICLYKCTSVPCDSVSESVKLMC